MITRLHGDDQLLEDWMLEYGADLSLRPGALTYGRAKILDLVGSNTRVLADL